jgi:uncharacterized DUF497 family protein
MQGFEPSESDDFRLVFGRSEIEYDPAKEEANRAKHGYSLEGAAHLLERLLLPTGFLPFAKRVAVVGGEVRHEMMTVDEGGVVFIVATMRPGDNIRVISFRRASADERAVFAELTGFRE